jgi:RNA polymerase sigma factor (sigma-70 family)
MKDDAALLRSYADDGSEAAFAELVRRHVDLVYGAALRRTGGDAHRAADVAQQVFTTVARQAHTLSRHPVLSAWLHTATRNAALNLMISEQRRKAREQKAAALEPAGIAGTPPVEWERVRPVLDAAIDELPETDRGAIVLRFLEQRPYAQLAAALCVSEDAARRRTERALEKLRVALARRGITSTAAALGALVGGQALVSAPAGLAATLASAAVLGASGGAGLIATFTSLMTTKIIATAAVSALVAFSVGTYVGLDRATTAPLPPAPEMPQHTQTIATLRNANDSLRAEVDALNAKVATLARQSPPAAPPAPRRATPAPAPEASPSMQTVSKQRAMLNNLRQISAARDQFQLEYGRPPTSMDELVGETKYIRRLNPVDGEDYAALAGFLARGQPLTVTAPTGVSVTYDPSGSGSTTRPVMVMPPPPPHILQLAERMKPSIEKALAGYQAANNGARPADTEAGATALLPYFATPQEGADFVEYMEAVKQAGRL